MIRSGARSRSFAALFSVMLAVATLGLAAVPALGMGAAAPLTRGFADDVWWDGIGSQWVPKTVATGARMVLLEVDWAAVEPAAPVAGEDPTSPADRHYGFGSLDSVLSKFQGSGISVALLVTDAPRWAQGPGGTADLYADGAWEPDAAALGRFATALARRYSGSYPSPANPLVALPHVRYYQAWAEANMNIHLSPQWLRDSSGHWVPASPGIYRLMLNAFYAGVKSAHADNVVIASGLAPYGDLPGGRRIPPVAFLRSMLCLQGRALAKQPCPAPAHFDVVAIDPYEVGSPTTKAGVTDDVSAPDLGQLSRVAARAVSAGTVLPRAHKRLWVTEFSYDSNPPNPTTYVTTAKQARWLEESFYVFWRQGVDTVFWYLIRDQVGPFATSYFSGVFFNNGVRKPSFEAYRFPLVVMRSGARATVWGISPRPGTVSVQHLAGRSWHTLFRVSPGAGAVFDRTVPAGLRGSYRAVVGGESSLVWSY